MTTNHTPKGYPPGPYIYQAKLTASENHKGFTVYAKSGTVPDCTGDLWIADVSPIDEDGIEGEAVAALFAAAPTQNNTLKLIQHFIHDWRNIARNALADDRGLTLQGTEELSNTLKDLLDYCETALSAAEPKGD